MSKKMAFLDMGKEIVKQATVAIGSSKLAEFAEASIPKVKAKGSKIFSRLKEKTKKASNADSYIQVEGQEVSKTVTMQKGKVHAAPGRDVEPTGDKSGN